MVCGLSSVSCRKEQNGIVCISKATWALQILSWVVDVRVTCTSTPPSAPNSTSPEQSIRAGTFAPLSLIPQTLSFGNVLEYFSFPVSTTWWEMLMRRIKLSKTLECETSNSQWRPRRRRQRQRWWPAPCHTELVHGRINNSDPIRILCRKQFRSLSHLHSYAQKTIFDTFWYASTPRCSWWRYPLTAFEKESRLLPNAVIFLSLHGLTPYTSKQAVLYHGWQP